MSGLLGRNLDRLTSEEVSIMLRILDHMQAVDSIFQHHLQGTPHTFRAPRSGTMPELEAPANGVRETDDFGRPVDFAFTSGKPARLSRGEIILHICLHGTYHRGSAGAVLQLKGIAPSRDSITDFLEDAA